MSNPIQPSRGISPLFTENSLNVRAQLFAKKSSDSSIDGKSVGCMSALWNAFVSVLSSIWHFFTACCNSSQKKKNAKKESLEETSKPEISCKLKPELFENFVENANSIIKEQANKNDHGLLDNKWVLFWTEIDDKKN